LKYGLAMKMTASTQVPSQGSISDRPVPQRLLGWTFRRGHQFLTCELHSGADGEYTVSVMPHSASGTMIVEHLASGVAAFHRHAAVALQLRQQGWTVVAYAPLTSPRTPAPQMYPAAA
jgi:hypothetical protein